MNITFFKNKIKKIKKWQRQGKYPRKKMENWIIGCRKNIEKLRANKKKKTRIKNAK